MTTTEHPDWVAGCPFCDRISQGDYVPIPSLRVARFEPLSPVTPGHMLFVPIRHIYSAASDPVIAGAVFEAAARFASQPPKGGPGDFNLITSGGQWATQTVPHFHVHYVPRGVEDGLHLPWTGQRERERAELMAGIEGSGMFAEAPIAYGAKYQRQMAAGCICTRWVGRDAAGEMLPAELRINVYCPIHGVPG